jgi:hypothetical protein
MPIEAVRGQEAIWLKIVLEKLLLRVWWPSSIGILVFVLGGRFVTLLEFESIWSGLDCFYMRVRGDMEGKHDCRVLHQAALYGPLYHKYIKKIM